MLKSILASIFGLAIIGIIYLPVKILERRWDEKRLDKISDDVKTELRKSPSYSLMSEEMKREFKKVNIKDIFGLWVFGVIFSIFIAPIYGITSLSGLLWVNVPFLFIFIYFAVKDSLRAARFREIYEIRAYCAEVHHGYRGSRSASLVYFDYKKKQYGITRIPVSSGHSELGYKQPFCWAMAVEKRESVKVIDISPRVYEKEGNKR